MRALRHFGGTGALAGLALVVLAPLVQGQLLHAPILGPTASAHGPRSGTGSASRPWIGLADPRIGLLLAPAADVLSWSGDLRQEDPEASYRCPVAGAAMIRQGNHGTVSHYHDGSRYALDYAATIGTPVVAARSGRVASVKVDSSFGGPGSLWAPYGHVIAIAHEDGTRGVYVHLRRDCDPPRVGDLVIQGEMIGRIGNTGVTHGPHLHFVVKRGGVAIPARFVDFKRNEGVPQKGDKHGPPVPPRVPQEVITRVRGLYRAVLEAQDCAFWDLGLVLAEEGLRLSPESSPYHVLLLEVRDRLFDRVHQRIYQLIILPELGEAQVVEAERFLQSLRTVKRLAPDLRELRDRVKQAGSDAQRLASLARPAVKTLIQGLDLSFRGEPTKAVVALAKARGGRTPAVRDQAAARITAILEELRETCRAEIDSLLRQSEECPKVYERALKSFTDDENDSKRRRRAPGQFRMSCKEACEDMNASARYWIGIFKTLKRSLKTESARLDALIQQIERDRETVLGRLGS